MTKFNAFDREQKMCDHFWYEEDWQGISVTHNICSDKGVHKIVVWVNHSRNWNVLQCLTKLGWELKWKVVNYNAADWKYYDKITKYSWKCKKKKKKINFQYFFTDKDFDDFDDTYDFEKEEIDYFKRDESVDKEDEEGGGRGRGGGGGGGVGGKKKI